MLTYTMLRAQFLSDTGGAGSTGAAPGLARALEAIGWRAVQESTPEELASHIVYLVDACVHDHYDITLLVYSIAGALRDNGPELDGGLPPEDAYVPAAEELLRLYVDTGR